MELAASGSNGIAKPEFKLQNASLLANGINGNGLHEPSTEELENQLPVVYDGQVPLGDLLSRVVQAIYAELCELSETLPNMSDSVRKWTLAEWVVNTKKQVVKLYAVVKWARDAQTVQKCMNITAFLMTQNQQFADAINSLTFTKDSLDPARLRNHDLLTSLDVLTTGSYRRLPSGIKKSIITPPPFTDAEVAKTLEQAEDAIRYKLRMHEIIPIEMSQHRIAAGRVYFTVPHLFEASLSIRGAKKDDGWFFVGVKFLIGIGGDSTGMQEFPLEPTGIRRQHIADEADARLAHYLPLPEDAQVPGRDAISRPRLPEGTVDASLVRLYNFLQIMSMSYQLEILWYQAQRMSSLGWADYLKIDMQNGRQSMAVSYWIRKPPLNAPGRPQFSNRSKIPLLGGTLIISIVESPRTRKEPRCSPRARVLAELQQKSKLGEAKPSDEVELLKFQIKWEPSKGALGVIIDASDASLTDTELIVESSDLDFESILRKAIEKHAKAILKIFQAQLQKGPIRVFSAPGDVTIVPDGTSHALHVRLCADEIVIVSIDARTGRVSLRDTGDLAAAGRGPRFSQISDRLNENPGMLLEALIRLRFSTITDLAEQKAQYLGLQSFRSRNFSREELMKLGPSARSMLYIQLANFPSHYLVLVITDDEFRYALISVQILTDTMYTNMIMEDIGWLDVVRVHGQKEGNKDAPTEVLVKELKDQPEPQVGQKRKRDDGDSGPLGAPEKGQGFFTLETQVLRELYAYCCARVAYTKVERQLKLRGIPYTSVNPTDGLSLPFNPSTIKSSLTRSVPALCVQSSDILSGAPAAEAAMPNIRVIPLNWWSESKKAQVVMCVKLKYVQQPVGKRAGLSDSIIRPSKRIIYDATEAVVSFLSEEVDTCVDEFLEEWARVSKMVVIAREVAQMATQKKWQGVRLLSFDLQTVEFAYAENYTVSITCIDQLSPTGGSFDLRFSRYISPASSPSQTLVSSPLPLSATSPHPSFHPHVNPHEDAEPFLRNILRHGRLATSLQRLVSLLRDTLPIMLEMESMRMTQYASVSSPGQDGHERRGQGKGKSVPARVERSDEWVDTFAKDVGWYRVLYGDRHALDFRLLTNHRFAILDGSNFLYSLPDTPAPTTLPSSSPPTTTQTTPFLGLQPIPDFSTLLQDATREIRANGSAATGRIIPVNIGIVCDQSVVRVVARAVHERVLRKLRG